MHTDQITRTRLTPTRIADETFVIHNHQGEGTSPVCVPLNMMLIRGKEPVVVDTGVVEFAEEYLEDLFDLVDPEDVRWVYISHDDIDHTGNVNEIMAACPNATLIINWFMVERLGETLEVPPIRWRWVGDGESFDAGDRTLHAVRPPIFDAPTTRGLFDPTTGVYWGSDSFATPMLTPVQHVDEMDPEFWTDGIAMFGQYVSPWLQLVDEARYQATVARVEALGPSALAGCHTPAVTGAHVPTALEVTRRTPSLTVPPQPDQSVLDEIQRTILGTAA